MAPLARPGPEAVRGRNRRRRAALLFVVCALAATTACSSDSNETAKQTPSASSASEGEESKPSADPTETSKAEAIGTYQAYWREMQLAYAKASIDGTDIKKFTAGLALSRAENDTKSMKESGQIVSGEVSVGSPTVTQIDLNRKIPNATISSCLDTSAWTVLDATTQKVVPQPTERLTKYVIVATVERWPDGWKVIEDKPQEKKC
ncbi:hypothetical protein ACFTTN_31660 [Streptomyces niveus]|uniref:hypothetical protein n=1 Tax=Streptomyces niveus TaxID=193462 RepID=UPI00364301DB